MNQPEHPPSRRIASLPIEALDFDLPADRIATRPAEPRDSARMLVVHLGRDEIEHRHVRDLPEYLAQADTVVFNRTKVQRARIIGRKEGSGGRVEGLVLAEADDGSIEAMLKSNGRLRVGQRIELLGRDGKAGAHVLELIERRGDHWCLRLEQQGSIDQALQACGRTPIPPYILRARGAEVTDDEVDRTWYQTVFAAGEPRSVAAPTAGLHFTPGLLERIDQTIAERLEVTLHVGPGTFQPVSAVNLADHDMHFEFFEVDQPTIESLAARQDRPGGRLFAIGTTSVRALESLPNPLPQPARAVSGDTDLLISPPYEFQFVDGLLTNFHLPRSTLLALVGAMVGLERLLQVYEEAITSGYRFYSYGDAMLIVP